MKKIRLDQLLVDRGLFPTRERAKRAVMEGLVFLDGRRVDKPGAAVPEDAQPEVRGNPLPYVSRGGLKLARALEVFSIDCQNLLCLDCGASTGGFTDVLLQHGAQRVYAVDVGYGQLAWKLRCDERVVNLERTNARYLTREQIPEPIDLVVMDLAFISIRLVLPAVLPLLCPGGKAVCLVKPQFEAGREQVGKKGVVRSESVHREVLESFCDWVSGAGYTLLGLDWSPIRGPEGNIEYLAYLLAGSGDRPDISPASVAKASHLAFSSKEELG